MEAHTDMPAPEARGRLGRWEQAPSHPTPSRPFPGGGTAATSPPPHLLPPPLPPRGRRGGLPPAGPGPIRSRAPRSPACPAACPCSPLPGPYQAELARLIVGQEAEDALDRHDGQPYERVALRRRLQGSQSLGRLRHRGRGEPRRAQGAAFPLREDPLLRRRHLRARPSSTEGRGVTSLPMTTLPPPRVTDGAPRPAPPGRWEAAECGVGGAVPQGPEAWGVLREMAPPRGWAPHRRQI